MAVVDDAATQEEGEDGTEGKDKVERSDDDEIEGSGSQD